MNPKYGRRDLKRREKRRKMERYTGKEKERGIMERRGKGRGYN